MDKKKVLIIALTLLALIAIAIISVKTYNDFKAQEHIDAEITNLNGTYQKFQNETDRTKKIEIMNALIKEFEGVKETEGPKSTITEGYEHRIQAMKQYFITDYETQISSNTIANIEKLDDKEQIETAKENLTNLLKFIETENLLTSTELDTHKTTINNLITSYNTRLEEIEKEEKAAQEKSKKQKEAAAKKKQEQETTTKERVTAPGTYPFPDHYIQLIPVDGVTGEFVYGTDYDRWMDPDTGIVYFNDGTIDNGQGIIP